MTFHLLSLLLTDAPTFSPDHRSTLIAFLTGSRSVSASGSQRDSESREAARRGSLQSPRRTTSCDPPIAATCTPTTLEKCLGTGLRKLAPAVRLSRDAFASRRPVGCILQHERDVAILRIVVTESFSWPANLDRKAVLHAESKDFPANFVQAVFVTSSSHKWHRLPGCESADDASESPSNMLCKLTEWRKGCWEIRTIALTQSKWHSNSKTHSRIAKHTSKQKSIVSSIVLRCSSPVPVHPRSPNMDLASTQYGTVNNNHKKVSTPRKWVSTPQK